MGIPIGVEYDDGVGALQVEAEPAGARRQQEDEVVGVHVVELLQQLAAVLRLRHTVQSEAYVTRLLLI